MAELNRQGMPGYQGRNPQKSITFLTGLLGADSTGAHVTEKLNDVNINERTEARDLDKRRGGNRWGGRRF